MNNRKASKTSIRLPKITNSPTKLSQQSKQRPQRPEESSPFTATSYGIYTTDLRPLICKPSINKRVQYKRKEINCEFNKDDDNVLYIQTVQEIQN